MVSSRYNPRICFLGCDRKEEINDRTPDLNLVRFSQLLHPCCVAEIFSPLPVQTGRLENVFEEEPLPQIHKPPFVNKTSSSPNFVEECWARTIRQRVFMRRITRRQAHLQCSAHFTYFAVHRTPRQKYRLKLLFSFPVTLIRFVGISNTFFL